ncbi:MAG: DUF4469 domain-containing protein [Tannerellaceae bacterium]|jgi:hypothetical protein|nr:DUF4469 domain-containing protein [Tannerellaceae bacterium]
MKNFFLSLRDVTHSVIVKFVHAYLPKAAKAYNAHVVLETELDMYEIAEKAAVYRINVDPDIITEGTEAFVSLCHYLIADGYKLKTPIFNSFIRIPGVYSGNEETLPKGIHPEVVMEPNVAFQEYIRERVKVVFDGKDEEKGYISDVYDNVSGTTNYEITENGFIDVHGIGLRIESDADHADKVGFFLLKHKNNKEIQLEAISVNSNRLLRVFVKAIDDDDFTLIIRTQSSTADHNSGHPLKNMREMRSDFTVFSEYKGRKDGETEETKE